MIKWHIEKRKVKDLIDHPKNPRRLTREQETQLITSLQKFGLIDKPCINLDNQLIGGHQRKRILKKLGYKEIDVLVPDRLLSDDEVNELCLRLNKNSGEWDYDALANGFDTEILFDVGFTFSDFSISEDNEISEYKESDRCETCGKKMRRGK